MGPAFRIWEVDSPVMTPARPMLRWMCLGLAAAACSNPADTTPGSTERLRIVAGPTATDTVTAQPFQALVVEIRDDAGALAPGVVVRFTGLPLSDSPPAPSMLVESVSGTAYTDNVSVTTDARGRAAVLVRFGSRAGPGRVLVTVPESGKADTAEFTVVAGSPASILLTPKDTTVSVGVSVQLSGHVVDRFQNPRNDAVTFSMTSIPAGTGTISSTGLLNGAGVGLVTVAVAAGAARDTARVSVVPQGMFAAVDFTAGLIVSGLDGSGYRVLQAQVSQDLEPAWAPDGTELLLGPVAIAGAFDRLPLVGPTVTVFLDPTPGVGSVFWPAYSPDGQFIYFSNAAGSSGGIVRSRKDGSAVEVLIGGGLFRPSISHDNRYLAFHTASGNGVAVQIFDLLTRNLLFGEQPGRFPEWSPVSDSLVAIDEVTRRLIMVHRDGGGRRFLTEPNHAYPDGQLTWSPDGQWILARGPTTLEIINAVTGFILPLHFARSMGEPAWKPGT